MTMFPFLAPLLTPRLQCSFCLSSLPSASPLSSIVLFLAFLPCSLMLMQASQMLSAVTAAPASTLSGSSCIMLAALHLPGLSLATRQACV